MVRDLARLKRETHFFLITASLLLCAGALFIYSSSSVYALEKFGNASFFLRKQVFHFIPGLIGFFFFAIVPLHFWKRYAAYFFYGALFLTLLTSISPLRLAVHGSSRWLSFAGISGQPSEILKLFLFMYMSIFLEQKEQRLLPLLASYLPFIGLLGVSSFVLLRQPDFGSVVTIFSTALLVFFVAHINMMHLLGVLAVCVPVGVVLVRARAYRLRRILIFLNPWADPLGRGFQIIQSLIAIGAGGVWGLGIGNSRQKYFYLPMQHTDFIFSIIAEETGFVGSVVLVLLFFALCLFGLRIVSQLTNEFAFFTSLSFVLFITLQAVINIMVATGLLPTKGLGLPFVSFGGSALLTYLCMIGFIVGCVRYERGLY